VKNESAHDLFPLDSTTLYTPMLTLTAGPTYQAASSFHLHPEDGGYNTWEKLKQRQYNYKKQPVSSKMAC
jgi:hypothetical protein